MVIDRETGQTPLSAAERMEIHDRQLGVEPIRPERPSQTPDLSAAARAESGLSARPAPNQPPTPAPTRQRSSGAATDPSKRPWANGPKDPPAPTPNTAPTPARVPSRPAPQRGGCKTIVTGKWWDAKGPRTIELGPKGQQTLSGGFVTLFFVLLTAAIVALIIQPILLFVGAFLLFRFGSNILGPLGAGIVDKAIAEKG